MADKMRAVCPNLTDDQITTMQKLPFRSFDPQILQARLSLGLAVLSRMQVSAPVLGPAPAG